MEAKMKTEDLSLDECEMFPELKLECKKEPVINLVPTLPGYVVSYVKEEHDVTDDAADKNVLPTVVEEHELHHSLRNSVPSAANGLPLDFAATPWRFSSTDIGYTSASSTSDSQTHSQRGQQIVLPVHTSMINNELYKLSPSLTKADSSQHSRDVRAATLEQCRDANIPSTSDSSKETTSSRRTEDGGSSNDTDVEDTLDSFRDNSAEVCPRELTERDAVPERDITAASAQNAGSKPRCLGPFCRPVECPTCSEEIPDGRAAEGHECFRSALSEGGCRSLTSVPPSGFKCTLCNAAVFYYPAHFKKHVRSHFINIYYLCSICGKRFRSTTTFVGHSYNHTGLWPYRCRVCGQGRANLHGLAQHELLHTDEKVGVCEVCGKGFRCSRGLYRHRAQHEGKFYPCSVCNSVFKSPEYLKRHVERHKAAEQPKKYKCDFCEKVYRTSDGLIIHKNKHHVKNRRAYSFPCNMCKKSYSTRHWLENHIVSHTGERRYTCDVCKSEFPSKMKVARHIAEHCGVKRE